MSIPQSTNGPASILTPAEGLATSGASTSHSQYLCLWETHHDFHTAHGSTAIPRLKILFSWTPEDSEQSVWKILFLTSACLGPCWIQGRNRLLNPFLRSHLATFQQWPANWWPCMDLCSSGLPMCKIFRTKHPISQQSLHLWSLLLNHQWENWSQLITAYHSFLELHSILVDMGMGQKPGTVPWTPSHSWDWWMFIPLKFTKMYTLVI